MTAAISPVAHGLLIGTAVVWLASELRQGANRRPEAAQADRGSRLVIRASILIAVAAAVGASKLAPGAEIRPASVSAWLGLGVLWCGIALRLWSFRTLGRYFTFTVQTSSDQPVIRSGPYRVVRHPSYTGVLLAIIGIGLLAANWLSLIAMTTAIACGLAYRIHVEERALLRDLGEDYGAYAATHKRLVPFIW